MLETDRQAGAFQGRASGKSSYACEAAAAIERGLGGGGSVSTALDVQVCGPEFGSMVLTSKAEWSGGQHPLCPPLANGSSHLRPGALVS